MSDSTEELESAPLTEVDGFSLACGDCKLFHLEAAKCLPCSITDLMRCKS